jgi:hypothetical protein
MKLEQIIQWIYLHRRSLVIVTIVVIPLLLLLNFFSSHAFVNVTIKTNITNAPITTYGSSPGGTEKVGGTGLLLITRDTTSLIVSSGEYVKTETKLELPWYGFASVDINLARDRNAEKVAFASLYGSDTCASYNKRLESLLSYKCINPPSLLQYQVSDRSTWTNKALAKNVTYPNKVAQPYLGGLLGVSVYDRGDESAPQPIIYTTDTGASIAYDMPEGIDESSLISAEIFTSSTHSTDNRFVFVTANGAVYLGQPTGNKGGVQYVHFDPPKDYLKTPHKTLCQIIGDNAYCYSGSAPIGDSSGQLANDDTINVYGFDGKTISSTNLHTNLLLDALYVTDGGQLYGKNYKRVLYLKKEASGYVVNDVSQNADSATATDTLYYVQKGGLYRVDSEKAAHQVFYSENIDINSVYASDGKLFMLGTLSKSLDKRVYAYLLKSDDDVSPGSRIIDQLPTEPGQLPDVTFQDLVGNKLQIQLAVPYTKLGSNGGVADSNSVLNEKKQNVLNALSTRGITLGDLVISFVY